MKKIVTNIIFGLCISSLVYAVSPTSGGSIPDISTLSQNANAYVATTQPILDKNAQKSSEENYLMQYYSVWNEQFPQFTLSQLNQWYDYFIKNPGVGENLSPVNASFFQNLKDQTDNGSFGRLMIPAIVTSTTNMRLAPTNVPNYSDANATSFDTLQCTSIYYGTPLMIIGQTKDKSWYFVDSGMQAEGWIPSSDIAFVSKEQIKKLENTQNYMVFRRDDVPMYNATDMVVAQGRIGMIMPLTKSKNNFEIIGYGKDVGTGMAQLLPLKVNREDGHTFPYEMTQANVANFINLLLGKPYGWGGVFGYRDCSLTQKDLMTQFGIFLNRNSGNLLSCGQDISLANLTNAQKLNVIAIEGVPFRTLLIMNGHVMLYIGMINGNPIMFHEYWEAHVITGTSKVEYEEKQSEITFVNLGVVDAQTQTSTILTAINAMVILGN